MPTIPTAADRTTTPTLHLALDLGNSSWQLAFTTALAQPPRLRRIPARALERLERELRTAKRRFGLAPDAPVVSCYEAGRDGFWVHRALVARGCANVVVDSASIHESRRARRAKSDRLDATALVQLLGRHHAGERGMWSVVHVPSVAEEDRRQLHRELFTLTRTRTRQINRIKGLLALQGCILPPHRGVRALPPLVGADGTPLPPGLQARLGREWQRLRTVVGELRALARERRTWLAAAPADPVVRQVVQLAALRGIGEISAWLYAAEFFSWRAFRNRREVAALAGLAPTTRASGSAAREHGISKAGNVRIRALAIELAWSWVRRQPTSALTQWFQRRFAQGGPRQRRIGIVAVARRLLVALWRYLETGRVPEGAQMKA